MRILVYPHDLGIGGSQLNALDLAASVRDMGHEVLVFGRPGPLAARIQELGLEFIAAPEGAVRPSPTVIRALRAVIRTRRIDVVHGYEWPPSLHAALAVAGTPAVALSTVMSMSVAPFIPKTMPLVVGTRAIAAGETSFGRRSVWIIEPPVDLDFDDPSRDYGDREFRTEVGVEPDSVLIVTVCRLAQALKLEGLLTAIDVVPRLAANAQLVIVGDGPSRADIDRAARAANSRAGRRAVIVAGAMQDPRPAYASADVLLGMGGSALRGLSFGKPLVVQGEHGFWRLLTPETIDEFLWAGWYGRGPDPAGGPAALSAALGPIMNDPERRRDLGDLGRTLAVECFSLADAAKEQAGIYEAVRSATTEYSLPEIARSTASFVQHAAARKVRRSRRSSHDDDFNATSRMRARSSSRPDLTPTLTTEN